MECGGSFGSIPRLAPNSPAAATAPRSLRDSPVAGVVLASADLDHVLGLLLLRELQPLSAYATASVLKVLREGNNMFRILNRVRGQVTWNPFVAEFALSEVGRIHDEISRFLECVHDKRIVDY